MYKMCMYYSIVHTRLIHGSDMSVHVYARWVGFQMELRLGPARNSDRARPVVPIRSRLGPVRVNWPGPAGFAGRPTRVVSRRPTRRCFQPASEDQIRPTRHCASAGMVGSPAKVLRHTIRVIQVIHDSDDAIHSYGCQVG